jgi:hypothetical protein
MERLIVDINRITVPKSMKSAKPKLYKLMGMEAYYKKYNHYYGEIIVNEDLKILDGYVIYYTAKNIFKQNTVPVKVVTKKERFVHFIRRILRKVGK